MTALHITGFYAGILAIIAVFLTLRVVSARRKHQVSIGDGGHADLALRIRVHGNFIETVPFALILLGLCEAANLSIYLLHLIGLTLLVGRIAHIAAMTPRRCIYSLRTLGMVLTFVAFLVPAPFLIWRFLMALTIQAA